MDTIRRLWVACENMPVRRRDAAPGGVVGGRHQWLVLSIVGLAAAVLALLPLAGLMLSLRSFIVLSGSMAPALSTGSLIVSEPAVTERETGGRGIARALSEQTQ